MHAVSPYKDAVLRRKFEVLRRKFEVRVFKDGVPNLIFGV